MNTLSAKIFSGFENRHNSNLADSPLPAIVGTREFVLQDMKPGLRREAALAILRDLETIASADWERDKLITLNGGLLVRTYREYKFKEIRINIENCVSSVPRHNLTVLEENAPSNHEIELHIVRMCLGALEAVL